MIDTLVYHGAVFFTAVQEPILPFFNAQHALLGSAGASMASIVLGLGLGKLGFDFFIEPVFMSGDWWSW